MDVVLLRGYSVCQRPPATELIKMGTSQSALSGRRRGDWTPHAMTEDERESDDKRYKQTGLEASNSKPSSETLSFGFEATMFGESKAHEKKQAKDESKVSAESSFGLDTSASQESKENEPRKATTLAQQLEEVRKAFDVAVIPYKNSDLRLPHPRHPYNFYKKNIRCGKCEGNCQICQVACCKHKYFEVRVNDNTISHSPTDEIDSQEALNVISFWQPTVPAEDSYVRNAVGSAQIGYTARIFNALNASQTLGRFATGMPIFEPLLESKDGQA
ncbi:MAG: hypothetical protein M1812_002355 [Candelaria pacifica]|nr:MAG: hypothetical protein M1812_002355 [Candelaria pacifica]